MGLATPLYKLSAPSLAIIVRSIWKEEEEDSRARVCMRDFKVSIGWKGTMPGTEDIRVGVRLDVCAAKGTKRIELGRTHGDMGCRLLYGDGMQVHCSWWVLLACDSVLVS